MKGTLIVIGFFILGIICGRSHWIPIWIMEGRISLAALCALMFCVMFSLGNNPKMMTHLKHMNPRLALLPLATITGTLAGALVIGCFLSEQSLPEMLAVSSGMGYYSLSSVLITGYKGAELGTIALLSNIIRELIALLGAPILIRWFGNLAPISVAGATSMDTALPIVTHYSGEKYIPVSVYHGFLTDSSVFFLVTIFCSI